MLNKIKSIKYSHIFWVFFLGSILGFITEGLWCVANVGHWENHSATVWGPFCIVYGIGAVVIYVLAYLLEEKNLLIQFGAYSIAGSMVEYLSSLFQEISFNTISWNYSKQFMNLGGRVSIQMTFFWGILGIIFVVFAFKPLKKTFEKPNKKIFNILCIILSIFMVVNLGVSAIATRRWVDRIEGIKAKNKLDHWLDSKFDDNRMKKTYSNMKLVK